MGFTLIELMIAMFLSTLLLATLSSGMYTVVNDWQRETSGLDVALDKSLAILQVEKAIVGAFPHTYLDPQTRSQYVYFVGSSDSMSWVSSVSPQRLAGLTTWQLMSEREAITLALTPAHSDNPEDRLNQTNSTILLQGYQAQFQYLTQIDDQEKEWLDEWIGEEEQSLPLAVHIIFTPEDEFADSYELIAPIRNNNHNQFQGLNPGFGF